MSNPEVFKSAPQRPEAVGSETRTLLIVLLVAVGLLTAVGYLGWIMGQIGASAPGTGAPVIVVEAATTHKVTPDMAAASEASAGLPAPAFHAQATDGLSHALADQTPGQPLALVFIKDGCPCSEAAQPFFNQLHRLYSEKAAFLGVINGDLELAARWGQTHNAAFPILADPSQTIIRDYQAQNSAYMALVVDGTLKRLWPGYSAPMIEEASTMLADLTGQPRGQLDLTDAPAEPYSGCPYELEQE